MATSPRLLLSLFQYLGYLTFLASYTRPRAPADQSLQAY